MRIIHQYNKMKRPQCPLILLGLWLLATPRVFPASPIGYLDAVGNGIAAGWASDPDYSGPVAVHIYVDGQYFHGGAANMTRSDVGTHGFQFLHPAFGPGQHQARAYAIGVNSDGSVNGNNPELGGSPKTWVEPADREFWLTSPDGQVRVAFDKKFGGSITKVYDYTNMGNLNLINWEQAGALFQPAFWLLPRHTQLPPNCPDFPDKWYDNPTLGGYYGDGSQGNPIGIMGTDVNTPDAQEFIQSEDSGRTVHFKSRFMRYDFCYSTASMDLINLWDTPFYLEQWATLMGADGRTMQLRSKIINAGAQALSVTTRQLPVIFAFHLPRTAFWQGGQKHIENYLASDVSVNPDQNWAALVAATGEVGIGMVTSASCMAMDGRTEFGTGEIGTGQGGERMSALYPMLGVPDLRTMGTLQNVALDPAYPDHAFLFQPGGSFEWLTYYPIGELNAIKTSAEALLAGTPPSTPAATATRTNTPSRTPTATASSTPTKTATAAPSSTSTNTPTTIPSLTSTSTPTITASPTLTATATPVCHPGDADHNAAVNQNDYRAVRDHFGQSSTTVGDADCNHFVNSNDYRAVRDNFGVIYRR